MNDKGHTKPPGWPLKALRFFLKGDYLEEIEGDMEEVFQDYLEVYSPRKAKWLYLIDTVKLLRPQLIKKIEGQTQLTTYGMFKNYLKVAFRIFKKEKSFTLINVLGLALAISCSLFIYLWVQDELLFNSHLESGDRVCYVMSYEAESSGDVNTYNSSPYNLKKVLQEEYPSISDVTIMSFGTHMAFEKNESLIENEGVEASPEFFEIFEVPFLKGDYKTMFDKPHTIAISASFAESQFGEDWQTQSLIGTNITNEWGESYQLVGIYADFPEHSTVNYAFVVPFEIRLAKNEWLTRWGNNASQIFVKLNDQVSVKEAEQNITNAVIDHRDDGEATKRKLFLQPFKDQYLYNRYEAGQVSGGRIEYVRLLSVAAILILVLASINFMNLSTARSVKRAKETGVRKVLGAIRSNLKLQFLTESLLITMMALLVSLGIVLLLLPQFNYITGKSISFDVFTIEHLLYLFGFVLTLGFLSGLYPAFYLSSIDTAISLKGGHKHSQSDGFLRKGLVVFQFVITIVMITGAITVYRQVSYIQTKNIGLDRSNLIRTWAHEINPITDYQILKDELLKRPGIENVTMVNQDLTSIGNSTSDPSWNGMMEGEEAEFYVLSTDPDFIPTARVKLKAGRNFDWDLHSDSVNYIINETAQKLMRMQDPVGEDLEMWDVKGKIIGVIEDFHNASMHRAIEPLIIRNDPSRSWQILARSKPGHTQEAIASLEEVYHMFNPKRQFQFQFMDEVFNQQYKSELMVKDLAGYFTILAVIISCLGLFALVAYSTEQRTKEIGIRKVLGASVTNIFGLLSREYLLILSVSLVIAIPVAYYMLAGWLDGFAYRISLSWWLFVLAGLIAVVIAYGIIGSHTIKSALANPVDSLRDE